MSFPASATLTAAVCWQGKLNESTVCIRRRRRPSRSAQSRDHELVPQFGVIRDQTGRKEYKGASRSKAEYPLPLTVIRHTDTRRHLPSNSSYPRPTRLSSIMPSLLDLTLDIRTLICREDVLRRKDLARLSRSCKAWHEAANPVLWSYIRLTNLLRLLPEGAFSRGTSCRGL